MHFIKSLHFLLFLFVWEFRPGMRNEVCGMCPGWRGSVAGASSHKPKGRRFDSEVRAHAWVVGLVPTGGVRETTDGYFFCTLMFLSLSFSCPSLLSKKQINKIKKKEICEMFFYNRYNQVVFLL